MKNFINIADIDKKDLRKIINNSKSQKNSLDSIQKSISNVGHDTDLFRASDELYNELPICCLYERKIEY